MARSFLSSRRPGYRRFLWFFPLLAVCCGSVLRADSIGTFSITNEGGYVIASDIDNPGPAYNRHAVNGSLSVTHTGNGNWDYRLRYSLRAADDSFVPIYDEAGNPGATHFSATALVSISFFISTRSYTVALRPSTGVTLEPGAPYRIHVEIARRPQGTSQSYVIQANGFSSPRPLYHFTSLVSGDSARNVILETTGVAYGRNYLIDTVDGRDTIPVEVSLFARRYDGFLAPSPSLTTIGLVFDVELIESGTGRSVPLESSRLTASVNLLNFTGSDPRRPYELAFSRTVQLRPAPGEQLNSPGRTYRVRVVAGHIEVIPSTEVLLPPIQTTFTRLLHFNGKLFFGDVPTTFDAIDNNPAPGSLSVGAIASTLAVSTGAGVLTDHPAFTYGNGSELPVELLTNGDARYTGGTNVFTSSEPEARRLEVAGIRFTHGNVGLNASGLFTSAISVFLPPGFGLSPQNSPYAGWRQYFLSGQPLTPQLLPVPETVIGSTSIFGITSDFVAQHQRLRFVSPEIRWVVAEGRFIIPATEVRSIDARLHARWHAWGSPRDPLPDTANKPKKANFFYQKFVHTLEAPVEIQVDGAGFGRMTADLVIGEGEFRPHFPAMEKPIAWTMDSPLAVRGNRPDPALSRLEGVQAFHVDYMQVCAFERPACDVEGEGRTELFFEPDGNTLRLTREGGLHSKGQLAVPTELAWGRYGTGDHAFFTDLFSEANFHMAGHVLPGSVAAARGADRAGILLLSGIDRSGDGPMERPRTTAYRAGLGDYAGLNFRRPESGGFGLFILFGGTPLFFEATERVKYYARASGVTGIHEAVPGSFAAPPSVYGYDLDLVSLGFNFLSNVNRDSATAGALTVAYPSDFTVAFEELKLNCRGDLDDAEIAEGQEGVTLAYWQADLELHALGFARGEEDACEPGSGFLTLGVSTEPAFIGGSVHGTLGFRGVAVAAANDPAGIARAAGNLLTVADAIPGVDSRLELPAEIEIDGPAGEVYRLLPAGRLYYNNFDLRPSEAEDVGYATFAGGLKVPFFRQVQVQPIVAARAGPLATLHLPGGWPTAGWTEAGENFFNRSGFDPDHRTRPDGVAFADYRTPNASTPGLPYHPRAFQEWLGIITFDYPLAWNSQLRYFRSPKPKESNFIILEIEHEVAYLSAENAELVFGAQYDGLPRINLANLAFNAVDEQLGIAQAFAEAAQEGVRRAVEGGVDALADLLEDTMTGILRVVLDDVVDPFVDDFYGALVAAYDDAVAAANNHAELLAEWEARRLAAMHEWLHNGAADAEGFLLDLLSNLEGAVRAVGDDGAGGIVRRIDESLADVETFIDSLIGEIRVDQFQNPIPDFVPPDPSDLLLPGLLSRSGPEGEREIVSNLINALLAELAGEAGAAIAAAINELIGEANAQVNALLSAAEPALDKVEEVLTRARDEVRALREGLAVADGIRGDFLDEITGLLDGARGQIEEVGEGVRETIDGFFEDIDRFRPSHQAQMLVDQIPSPFEEYGPEEVKALIRREIEDRFVGTALVGQLRVAVKRRIHEVDAVVKEAVDTVFAEVNGLIRNLLSGALAGLDDEINGLLGDLSDVVGAGEINGYAHIQGDALRRLRLDGRFAWRVPDELTFAGYLQIEQLNSDGRTGCGGGPGETLTEIRIGATDVSLGWIGDGLRADIGAKFTLASGATYVVPVGLGGSFALTGGALDFETFTIEELSAGVGFGLLENYLTAATRISFQGYTLAGGIFFGRTCTTEPIALWDPEVADLIGDGPFTGGYAYFEGWIPVSQVLFGIPPTCFFTVSAGVGMGVFYFVEGPTYGGRVFAGLSGEILCVVTAKGELRLTGVKQGGDFRFTGSGKVSGSAGKCPFCIKASKSFKAAYENGSWSIDL